MGLKVCYCLLATPEMETPHEKMKPGDWKKKLGKTLAFWTIVFLIVLAIIICITLFSENFSTLFFIACFAAIGLGDLLRKVRALAQEESYREEKNTLYFGAAAVLLSLLFFGLWVLYCRICVMVGIDARYNCVYPPYIFCVQVALLCTLLIVFSRKEKEG